MGMPCLKPKEVTDTVRVSLGAVMPKSRSSSPRNRERLSPVELRMWVARRRTGSRATRSSFTASGRGWPCRVRGWVCRVSLYRLMMTSSAASTKRSW